MERSLTCWSCEYCGETERGSQGKPQRVRCLITGRMGKLARGNYCRRFEYKQRSKELGDDGIPIKNRQPLDYRTRKQWEAEGRQVKEGEAGKRMHASRMSFKVFEYFLIEQTEVIEDAEG